MDHLHNQSSQGRASRKRAFAFFLDCSLRSFSRETDRCAASLNQSLYLRLRPSLTVHSQLSKRSYALSPTSRSSSTCCMAPARASSRTRRSIMISAIITMSATRSARPSSLSTRTCLCPRPMPMLCKYFRQWRWICWSYAPTYF